MGTANEDSEASRPRIASPMLSQKRVLDALKLQKAIPCRNNRLIL